MQHSAEHIGIVCPYFRPLFGSLLVVYACLLNNRIIFEIHPGILLSLPTDSIIVLLKFLKYLYRNN